MIRTIPFSLGYTSGDAAQRSRIPTAAIINKAGNIVMGNGDGIKGAMLNASFDSSLIDLSGEDAYPISAFTYLITSRSFSAPCDVPS